MNLLGLVSSLPFGFDCRKKMKVFLLMLILTIASVRFSNGEEEEDRDELQQGFFEVDYMLQVLLKGVFQVSQKVSLKIVSLKCPKICLKSVPKSVP